MGILSRWKRKKMLQYLTNSSPEKLLKIGENKLIPLFKDAANRIPAYKQFLREKNIDIDKIKDINSFRNAVPLIDKEIFKRDSITELCKDGDLKKMSRASVSSGFSGDFSYGLTSNRELQDLTFVCDLLLDYAFDISKKKTFFINSLGMGVRVFTNLPMAETSVRADMVLAFVNKFAPHYDQIIILANTYFAKKIIEDGIEQGIDWKSIKVNLIIGEDWFPENYRNYLAHCLGIDFNQPSKGRILSTMGVCELGITLFQESKDTIRIRQLAQKNAKLRRAIFGENTDICPILFHYHPYQIFLEQMGEELIFTSLSRDAIIPLIRYATKDRGKIHSYNSIEEILTEFNLKDCVPELKLPLVSLIGRSGKVIELEKITVTPEQIKAGLYSDFEVAFATTGYFRISKHDNQLRIEAQLRRSQQPTEDLKKKFIQAIAKYVKTDFELQLYHYMDFPYGMEISYENKFKYI